jgi:hypothetical protein
VYAKNSNFKTIKIDFKQNNVYECILLKIKPKNSKHFYLSKIYCPPNKTTEFKSRFEEDFKLFLNKDIIFTGDYNIDTNSVSSNKWFKTCVDLSLTQLIKSPTRVRKTTATIIYHIYVNQINNVFSSGVLEISISDNFPVFLCRKINSNLKRKNGKHISIRYQDWENFNVQIIEEIIAFKPDSQNDCLNEYCNDFNQHLININIIHKHFKYKAIQISRLKIFFKLRLSS